MCLMPVFVRIRETVETRRVRSDTIPPLGAGDILNEIKPPISLRNRLVFVAVPLGDLEFRPAFRR